MKNFDIKRFVQLAKWSLLTGKKKTISLVAGMTIGMVAAFVPQMLFGDASDSAALQYSRLVSIVQACSFIIGLSFVLCGCWLFDNMKTKQERIAYLMLPASTFEKYLVRYLMLTVGVTVCWIVAFSFADIIRILVSLITGRSPLVSALPILFGSFMSPGNAGILINGGMLCHEYFAVCVIMFHHSLYILGGTLFRRRQFVFTSMVIFAAMILTGLVLEQCEGMFPGLSLDDIDILINIVNVVLTVLTVVCYWLSYNVFKRMQVINNKWINL